MNLGLGLGLPFAYAHPLAGVWTPATLFSAGEQGAWYDPSDTATLYQDAAGTTPVTAVEQPVGRMLDKSGRGNHATQTTATSRPVLSARVNLLTKTEQFDDAVWFKGGAAVWSPAPTAGGSTTAPDGTSTARLYTFSAAAFVRQELAFPSGIQGSAKVYVRAGLVSPAKAVRITTNNTLNWSTGFSTKVALTREWQLVTHSGVLQTGSARVFLMFGAADASGANDPDCVGSIELWHPSLVPANQASLPYQRVNTATDYDADPAKFPAYLRFDGVDDGMMTSAITPGTDKAQFFAGLEKLSDAAFQVIAETGTGTQTGTISLSASLLRGTRQSWAAGVLGTTSCAGGAYGFPAPDKRVLTALLDIAGSTSTEAVRLRLNGVSQTLNYASTASAGTGVLGTYPLYIGRRSSGSFPLNGRLYGLIVRFGAPPPPQTIADTEDWLNQRMA